MGDGDRAALGDLRSNSGTTEPVEPSTLPKRTTATRAAPPSGDGVDAALGDALGGAHDVGRVHRLVGGDEDQGLAVLAGEAGDVDRAADVGEHRLGWG